MASVVLIGDVERLGNRGGVLQISTYADCMILSMPLGPKVLLTRSPTAMAPTKAVRRAFSPFSSVVPSSKIWVGLKEDCAETLLALLDGRDANCRNARAN